MKTVVGTAICATILALVFWLSPRMVVTRGIFTSPDGKYTMRIEVHMAKHKIRTLVQEVESGDVKMDTWEERDGVGVDDLTVTWVEARRGEPS